MTHFASLISLLAIVCLAEGVPKALVEVESGSATFDAITNMPGIEVKGKSNSLSGRVELVQEGTELALQRLEASLPVKTLLTGMKVRDEHMRKYIFTNESGQEPDLRFTADMGSCPASGASHQFACRLNGNLSIRGLSRPIEIQLRVKQQGSALAFRVEGDGVVRMSDYGITPPSQFGVKPANEVKFHLDFTGKAQ